MRPTAGLVTLRRTYAVQLPSWTPTVFDPPTSSSVTSYVRYSAESWKFEYPGARTSSVSSWPLTVALCAPRPDTYNRAFAKRRVLTSNWRAKIGIGSVSVRPG